MCIKTFALMLFTFIPFTAAGCPDLTTSNEGFSIRNVKLKECFIIPSMGKEYVYKLSKVCLWGDLDRDAFTKLKVDGKFRSEVKKTVRSLHDARIEKVACG